VNIINAMTDPKLFGNQFAGESWAPWLALLAGFYGLPMTPEQRDIFQTITERPDAPTAPHDELWLIIGRRGGKSFIAALLAVFEAVFNNHKDRLAAGEVATVAVIASDRKQARTVLRYIKGLLQNPLLEPLIVREGPESIELSNYCVIEIMTASYRASRGYTLACVICDEIAFWMIEGANPDADIIRAIRPSLATLGGKLIALSSPYARRGVLWSQYRAHYGRAGRILVAQAPTALMNPTLPVQVIADAYHEDPLSAAAEFGAQFRTDVEGFVTMEVLDACTRPSQREILPDSSTSYTAFVDPSGGSADAFTLAIAHRTKDKFVIIDATRTVKPPFSPESVVVEFCTLLKSYRIREIHGDAYAGEWPREQFAKRGITYKRSQKNKSELYQDLLPMLNSNSVELPPDNHLHRELLGLERRTARGGRDSIDHAPGMHDDLANAVAGALVHARTRADLMLDLKVRFPT
jgi:hypothetical protein